MNININKKILSTIIEILFLLLLIIITRLLWNDLRINQSLSTKYISKNNNLNLKIKENHLNYLYATDDQTLINENYIDLEINNSSKSNINYVIYLIVNESEINLDYVKIKFNNKIYNLNDLEKITIDNKKYYTLEEKTSFKNTNINKRCNLWISNEIPDYKSDNNLEIEFKIDEI